MTLLRTLDAITRKDALLLPHLEAAIVKADWPSEWAIKIVNEERVPDGNFHPSSHLGLDPLQLYYMFHPKYSGAMRKETISPSLQMIFQVGHAFHAMIQGMLIHLGFTTVENCEVGFFSEARNIRGTLDVLNAWLPGEEDDPFPVEIKSWARVPSKPVVKHVEQFQTYMDLAPGGPYRRGSLLYIEKSSPHRITEFVITRDESVLNPIYSKLDAVMGAVEKSDPSGFSNCCNKDTKVYHNCPARYVCRINGEPQ